MPKNLVVDPGLVRRAGTLSLAPIGLNLPAPAPMSARASLGDDTLRALRWDMVLIREFESMLDTFKRSGHFAGISYDHAGPTHLSIGQEAAAVGQAAALELTDAVFGSHRSHGEFLAKGLAAIRTTPGPMLTKLTEAWLDGDTLRPVESNLAADDEHERATQFLCYGLIAEIFGRRTGVNRGLGGSMHAFFPPFGVYPNNAIVGGSAPIATGAALFRRVTRQTGIVVANIGDASTGCGPVWESLNFAAMGQLVSLWDADHRGGLPVVFFFVNNFYGMGGQTIGETMGYDRLARVGAGVRADNLHAETVDGNDPLAVFGAMGRARAHIEGGQGPVLLDVQTYRQSGHSPSDPSSYRTNEELALWRAVDPVSSYDDWLRSAGIALTASLDDVRARARRLLTDVARLAVDLDISPRLDLGRDRQAIGRFMFSNRLADSPQPLAAATLVPLSESSRVRRIAGRSRVGRDATGTVLPGARAVQLRDALFEAIAAHAAADESLVIYGEENRDWDGAFGVYRGLTELLPYHRLFNAPISEAAIVGTAVGYAMAGGRALIELMYCDFLGRAGDEVFNQLAKWQAMSGGVVEMPVVVRVSVGRTYGAQHSQDWSSLVHHIPGLKIAYPATPYDAKGLLATALSGSDPVIFFESQRLYSQTELVHPDVPTAYYRVPFGVPHVAREGADLTIVAVGPALYAALDASDRLAADHGRTATVIDPRTIVPLDATVIVDSVLRTGRLLCVGDGAERGSWLHTLASHVNEQAFGELKAAPVVLGTPNWITPPAGQVDEFFPTADRILDAVHTRLLPLSGYTPTHPAEDRGRLLAAGL